MAKRKQEGSRGVVEVRKDVPISGLKADPKNPREWDGDNLKITRASISRFGFVEPVVVNDRTGMLVAGHQRIAALKREGKSTVPLVVAGDWTADDARTLSVVLNGKPTRGRFVTRKLKPMLADLEKSAPDVYVQLGLGMLLDQAEAEEAGNGTGKKSVVFEAASDKWETVKYRVPPGVKIIVGQKVQAVKEIHGFKTEGEAVEAIFADYEPHRIAGVGG